MSEKFKDFARRWLINTGAVAIAACLVKNIHYQKTLDLVAAALLLGILNSFLRPLLMLISLPLMIFTLGLFTLVINALLLYWVGGLLKPGFEVPTFRDAFWGALIISIVTICLNSMTGFGNARIKVHRAGTRPPPPRNSGGDGDGPVIDI